MSKPSIYLSGPISGLSYREARFGWRQEFASYVDPEKIDLFSPMRQESHLAEIQSIENKPYGGSPLSQSRAIVAKDRLDTQRCDVLVAGLLGAKIVSVGTLIEIGWADAWDKTTIVILEDDGSNPMDRFFLTELADFRVASVKEAAEVAKAILLPGV